MSNIIELRAENIKKLKAVEIRPTGNTVLITGANGQGKSSVLDSIFFAFAGKEAQKETPKPIRDGESGAEVNITTSDGYKLRRWWTKTTSYLEITAPDGSLVKSPQAMLDSWAGMLTFDPLGFSRMSPKQQRDELLVIIDCRIDLDKWEADVAKLREDRRLIGRDCDQFDARVKAYPLSELQDAPEVEISVSDLAKALQGAFEHNGLMDEAESLVGRRKQEVEEEKRRVAEKTRELEAAKARLDHAVVALMEAEQDFGEYAQPIDTSAIKQQMVEVETQNVKARKKKEYSALKKQADDVRAKYCEKEQQIERKEQEKLTALKSVKMPIDGLGLDSSSVTYNGQPYSQLSSAEQLRVALSIAMAKKPQLRVIRILDGSLLDDKNLELVQSMAKEHDFQVWIEKVDTSGKVGVVIEDGMVAANNYPIAA